MEKTIIAAVADNGAIGRDNSLLWHISEDLRFFRKTTTGHAVIMGRKTYESIGRPLPNRLNIVITRSAEAAGIHEIGSLLTAPTLTEAFRIAELSAGGHTAAESGFRISADRCFVTGGGEIYRKAIGLADSLIITRVHIVISDADTFFPEIDPEKWAAAERSAMMTDPESGLKFEFVKYIRK